MSDEKEFPPEVVDKVVSIVNIAKDTGKIRKGINEATKSIESGKSKLVIIAEDVDPKEIVMHLPDLCTEKGVIFGYVKSKEELGKAAGLNVPCSAISIEDPGGAKEVLNEIISKTATKERKEERKEKKKEEREGKKKEKKEEK